MINISSIKLQLVALALVGVIIIAVIVLFLYSAFSKPNQNNQASLPTPTLVPNPSLPSKFTPSQITPLQKTIIGQTTDADIVQKLKILSKKTRGNTTIYEIKSTAAGVDEIRTEGGKVVLERTSTQIATPPPPKIAAVEKDLGQPEKELKQVGPVGWYTNAYVYASKGLLIYANRYTGTVYEVQRFIPMSQIEYEKKYGSEFLQPAQSDRDYVGN